MLKGRTQMKHLRSRRQLASAALATMTVVSVSLAATPAATAAPAKLKSIFFANPLPSYPSFALANRCFSAETKKLGIQSTSSGPSGLTVNNQYTLDGISQAIADHYGAIIMVPIEPPQFDPLIKQARAAGILVATINTGNSTTLQNVELGTDYTDQAATIVANLAKRPGQQYLLEVGNSAGGPQLLFVNGLKAGIASHPNVHLVTQVFDGGDPNQTTDVVETALEAHPNVNIVVTWEGTATQGVVTAIKESHNVGKIFGVVNDLTPESIAGMKGGEVYGISKQNFCGMATGAVDDLAAIAQGKPVPKYVDTGITFVTKQNLAMNE
jgi:ribose transport system substrate-binding protein